MSLPGILLTPWAILPSALAQIEAIYAAHLQGQRPDIRALEASIGRPLANDQPTYSVEPGGVGVLRAAGVMSPKANLLIQVSGGISTQMLARQFDSMAADPRVLSAVFAPDSPGGNALGVPAAARALARLASAKPTVTVGEGVMASAMYWVASAANAMFIEGETDMVGSLGVVQRLSWDPANPNSVDLVRGKYKRISVNGAPPDAAVMAHHETQMDYLYSLLVDTVAEHRGVPAQQVLERMADGRVFIGQQAIDAGLVDGVSTVDAMVQQMASNPSRFKARQKAGRGASRAAMPALAAVASPPLPLSPPLATLPLRDQVQAVWHWAGMRNIKFAKAAASLGLDIPRATLAAEAQSWASAKRISFLQACHALGITH